VLKLYHDNVPESLLDPSALKMFKIEKEKEGVKIENLDYFHKVHGGWLVTRKYKNKKQLDFNTFGLYPNPKDHSRVTNDIWGDKIYTTWINDNEVRWKHIRENDYYNRSFTNKYYFSHEDITKYECFNICLPLLVYENEIINELRYC
jgi:hypothetical protein